MNKIFVQYDTNSLTILREGGKWSAVGLIAQLEALVTLRCVYVWKDFN